MFYWYLLGEIVDTLTCTSVPSLVTTEQIYCGVLLTCHSTGRSHAPEIVQSYGKCSKISNTFLFLFSNKMLLLTAEVHKILVRIANREDPDQTASRQLVFKILEHIPY